jgi:hypothetical protein
MARYLLAYLQKQSSTCDNVTGGLSNKRRYYKVSIFFLWIFSRSFSKKTESIEKHTFDLIESAFKRISNE